MKYTLARYTVRPEKVREVKRAIAEFVSELRLHEPRTLYLVFREENAHSFAHWMSFENDAAERRHSQSKYNQHFVRKLMESCVGKPTFTVFDLFSSSRKHWPLDR
jgi:quinol monooxygenase YgiN